VQRVYAVGDLVVPPNNKGQTAEARLLQVITAVAPRTWRGAGGRGTAQYYPLGLTIVVSQTADVQRQVADLLRSLRQARITWHKLQ
jgi:hypothetical protein